MNYSRMKKRKMYLQNRKIRRQRLSFLGLAVLILICCFSMKTNSSASVDSRNKYYKSVKIENGDSLWSIAEEFYTDDWENLNLFIDEIKCFNGIASEQIHAGNYIAIPYYEK